MASDRKETWEKVKAEVLAEASFLTGEIRNKSVGKKTAQKYLLDLYELVVKLCNKLDEMPSEAREALLSPFPMGHPFPIDLDAFKHDLINSIARPASDAITTIRDDPRPGRKGRMKLDWRVAYVTRLADKIYKDHTGKTATRKELAALLEDPLLALEIKAKPSSVVRDYRGKIDKK
jgi:hypothetical protein